MQFRSFLATILLFSLSGAIPVISPPSVDPFYQPPSGFELASPGTILKSRLVPSQLRAFLLPVQVKGTWQLLVRSNDSHGNASVVVTTVIEPYNADPSKLASYQVAEDSSASDCAVSWAIQEASPNLLNINSQIDMLMMQTFLNEGWYVQTPDYEGTHGAFTVGRQAGQATLDTLRATLSSQNLTGVDPDAKVIFYGYSGGSIASSWAGALQPKYAPELKPNLIGVAIGGWVTNITATAEAVDGGIFAGLTAGAINGLIHEYPDLDAIVREEVANEEAYKFIKWAGDKCLVINVFEFAKVSFFSGENPLFSKGWDFFDIPEIQKVTALNTLALSDDEMPEIPFFVFHSKNDEIAPHKESLRAYNNWCDWGIESLEFAEDVFNEHVSEFILGAPSGFSWMQKIFNGTAPIKGCTKTTRFNNLQYTGAHAGLVNYLKVANGSAFQENIGTLNRYSTHLE